MALNKNTINNYNRQVVAFIDLLGIKQAVCGKDIQLKEKIINLFKNFSLTKSNYCIQYDGIKFKVLPAISAFSDHVVISYKIDEKFPPSLYLSCLESMIAYFAQQVMDIEFLIRGAITIDYLYHEDGVVFGEGIINAYKMESEISVYPRVIVSNSFLDFCNFSDHENRGCILRDTDGISYLNYINNMICRKFKPGDAWIDDVLGYAGKISDICDKKIQSFDPNINMKEIAKWNWFLNQYKKNSQSWFEQHLRKN